MTSSSSGEGLSGPSTPFLLKVQVFTAGFAVMSLELLGSRIIARGFGSTTWTWGSLIGVVLAGLAAGYQVGGKLADKSPTRGKFAAILFLGGFLLVMVPQLSPYEMSFVTSVIPADLPYAPLVATTLILGLQTFVLGLTSPYAVRLASKEIRTVGKVTGSLYSLSTLGSIVGTFGTVYVLLPSFDVDIIVTAMGIVVMGVSISPPRRKSTAAAMVLLLLVLTPTLVAAAPQVAPTKNGGLVVLEKETPYSSMDVVDFGNERILYLNGLIHSGTDLGNSTKLVFQYSTYFNLGMQLRPNASRVLVVGGGGFSVPKYFLSAYPKIRIDVAEIDPDVIATAFSYFGLTSNPRLTIYNEDARVFLGETTATYDLVVLDAYGKTYVPFHLMTKEFFGLLSRHLVEGGVVISNIIGSLEGDASALMRAYYKTALTSFGDSVVFHVDTPVKTSVQNLEIAFMRLGGVGLRASVEQVQSELQPYMFFKASEGAVPVGGYVSHLVEPALDLTGASTLTDSYAPVESLLNPITGTHYELERQFGSLIPALRVPLWLSLLTVGESLAVCGMWLYNARRDSSEQDPGQASGPLSVPA